MSAENETVIHVTPNAAWLPPGSMAEVVKRSTPPQPISVVRLLIRTDDRVFCLPRPEGGGLDLPMLVTEEGDSDGTTAMRLLADRILGPRAQVRFIGAVRNVVRLPSDDYRWPAPIAHFGVWTSQHEPLANGTWVHLRHGEHRLCDRHWYPLTMASENTTRSPSLAVDAERSLNG